ncbi:MAG: HD domain-containing phosphohydrolase [Limisphaerales bacterium]
MNERILCVDDEPNLLAGIQRTLRKQFQLETAPGGEAALALLEKDGPVAVIVSDMRMPGLSGLQLLAQVKERWPDTVRVMLTGNADQQTAIDAVNEGSIFRFLTKPCPPETLATAFTAGLAQHRLITAERELLEKTLNGSVGLLTEMLSVLDPVQFGRCQVLRDQARAVAGKLNLADGWEVEMGAMLHGIGRVTLPPEVAARARADASLSEAERTMIRRLPEAASNLLAHVPRLEPVARIVLFQDKHYDGSGFPIDTTAGRDIPAGARLLKILIDLKALEERGRSRRDSLLTLRERAGFYDPDYLEAVAEVLAPGASRPVLAIPFRDLRAGHILVAEVVTRDGMPLISGGNRVTPGLLQRLHNFSDTSGLREPIYVEG